MTLEELLDIKTRMGYPSIVCHCGSTTRAANAFQEWQLKDTLDGFIVLTIGAHKNDASLGITPEQAVLLDALHLWKVELCDFVRVLNVNGYIGESTAREIMYAEQLGKPILYIEPHK